LGGSQISTLLETLPGIANVLRSPVADALLNVIRAAAGLSEFAVSDAEELIRYAVRRGLVGAEEGERALTDILAAQRPRPARIPPRARTTRPKGAKKAKGPKRAGRRRH
jgi:hypothetical protein